MLGEQIGARAEEVGNGLLQINEHHPHDEPHFYLFILGARRAQQGNGLGSKLIREVLEGEFAITHTTIQFEHTHAPGDFHKYMPEPAPSREK